MIDWENIRHFVAVARAGTLSGAARALRVDHATVSRRLAALEAEMKQQLVERLPRSCRLTTAGIQVFEQAKMMENAVFAIERLKQAQQTSLNGRVTLSTSPVLATYFLAPRMADFHAKYPGIQLSVTAEARQISLSRGEADIALRHTRPAQASNITRRIGRMPFDLYASHRYPELPTPDGWRFIAYDAAFADMPQQHWLLEIAGKRPIVCELSDISGQLLAACAGAGVAGLPCFLGDAHSDLIKLEHSGPGFSRDIWLVTHRDLKHSATVRAVMDYLAECFDGSDSLHINAGTRAGSNTHS